MVRALVNTFCGGEVLRRETRAADRGKNRFASRLGEPSLALGRSKFFLIARGAAKSVTKKGKGPPRFDTRAGRLPVQFRFATNWSSAQYVKQKAWRSASLDQCPLHPNGGCGFKRNGSYGRVEPPGARIARWYCPAGRTTFSGLPDCLAAKWSSSLAEVEQVIAVSEQAQSLQAAAERLRPDIEFQGSLRWVRRRTRWVKPVLTALIALLPELLAGCEPTLSALGERLGTEQVLVELRSVGQQHLPQLPPPLGFGRRLSAGQWTKQQHDPGARAPPSLR